MRRDESLKTMTRFRDSILFDTVRNLVNLEGLSLSEFLLLCCEFVTNITMLFD